MNGIGSWSVLAGDENCPGSKNDDGSLVQACAGCYAKGGCYVFTAVKNVRIANKSAWKEREWVDVMVFSIKDHPFFRWFDSGDCYDLNLANKIHRIMQRTPNTKHWLPTRMWKFPEFKKILDKMNELHNVVVRYSADSITGEYQKGLHGSVIIPYVDFETDAYVCPSTKTHGKCSGCNACWSKDVPTIAYVAHGRKMLKILQDTIPAGTDYEQNKTFLQPA